MAVLTKSHPVTAAAWTEVTAALAMANNASYSLEVQDDAATGEGHVQAVVTDDNNAPGANVRGVGWYPRTAAGAGDHRPFTKKANRYLWMRSSGPDFHVVANPA